MELFLMMLIILVTALLLDLTLGEPFWQSPTPLHPTIVISNFVKRVLPFFKNENPKLEKLNGTFLAITTILITTTTAYLILYTARLVFILAYLIFSAVILKLTICIKLETEMANKAADCIKEKNLEKGREIASLFSRRNVKNLDEKQIASAVIESIAENLADFKVSPMFYYAIFGVPGAVAFKTINILDGTVGFKDEEHIHIGWFSAMADTAANFLLSRLTAILIALAAFLTGENGRKSWEIMLRDYKKVPSINHGWPIAAMAGALGAQLEKPGYYVIGEMKQTLSYTHIKKALKIRNMAIILFIILIEFPTLFLSATFLGMLI